MENTDDEIKRLHSCINDLISVLALPAIWSGSESTHIVGTLLDVLLAMLRLDFAYARLRDSSDGPPIEVVRSAHRQRPSLQPQQVGDALGRWLTGDQTASRLVVSDPAGEAEVSIVSFPLGLQPEVGVLVAGSQRADFPTDVERLLLRVAVNQAGIGLQEARRSGEQKRVAEALEQRVAERTKQLAGEKRLLEMIARGESRALILDALCRLVEELTSGSLSSILLLDPNASCLRYGAAPSLPGPYLEAIDGAVIGPAAGSCGTAAYLAEPVIVADIATDPLWVDYRDLALAHGLRACWSTPILSSEGRVLGTFATYYREPRRPTPQEQNVMEQFTHLASIAVEREQAEEALREQASLLNLTRDSIFVRGMDDVIKYWNRGAEELYGWTAETAVDKISHQLLQTVFPAPIDEISAKLLRTGRWEGELVHTKADGTPVVVASRWALQSDAQGHPLAVLETNNDITARKQAEQALEDLAGRLIHAQEEERKRIGRELHDHVSQTLGVLTIKIDQLRANREITPATDRALEELRRETRDITDDVHRLSYRLHSSTLDYLGLVPALQTLVAEFSKRHDISVTFVHAALPPSVPPEVALCLFRVAEESLTNIAKHSNARSADIHVAGAPDGLHLRVEDAGTGFDMATLGSRAGLGFVSMQERLRALHGTMHVDSAPSRGTRIEAWVPSMALVRGHDEAAHRSETA